MHTRFPPEPNGYLHFGHVKSICLNFGIAEQYGGACNLRFDDTNPEKEEQEYVDSIKEGVKWLGFDWGKTDLYASDYFGKLYEFAEALIKAGKAYVDSQSAEQMSAARGSFTEPGKDSPWRNRTVDENLALFRGMRDGQYKDGAHVLRAKIDMRSPNLNLRDPVMYRIRHAHHHRTGDKWCIYPTYDWAHGLSDCLEGISHSLCTLEFEDHRPLYDWFNEQVAEAGLLPGPTLPKQIEFARLNLTYVVLSKRKLIQLVDEHYVDGWDDPRMPTLAGARRRGYTPEGFRLFAERIGVSKANQLIDFAILEDCMREHLNDVAPRRMAVLDAAQAGDRQLSRGQGRADGRAQPSAEAGLGQAPGAVLARAVDREGRLPGKAGEGLLPPVSRQRSAAALRLRREVHRHEGRRRALHLPPGFALRLARRRQVQGERQHPLGEREARLRRQGEALRPAVQSARARQGARFHPGSQSGFAQAGRRASSSPPCADTRSRQVYQFERHGYFIADYDELTFNRTVTLRDSWATASQPPKRSFG